MTGSGALLYKIKNSETGRISWPDDAQKGSLRNVPWPLCNRMSTVRQPLFLGSVINKEKGERRGEFILGQFHLWPLFIQSPSNHRSPNPQSATTNLQQKSPPRELKDLGTTVSAENVQMTYDHWLCGRRSRCLDWTLPFDLVGVG